MNTVFSELVKVLIAIFVCYFLIAIPVLYIQDNFNIIVKIRYDFSTGQYESHYVTYIKFMLILFTAFYINKIKKYLITKELNKNKVV